MDSKAIAGEIAEQDWLEPLADTVQSAIATAFESAGDSGKQIKDTLHGTWLGHPLHPVLTDVPIGAWTTAVALDMLDSVRKDDALLAGAEAASNVSAAICSNNGSSSTTSTVSCPRSSRTCR